MEDASLPPKARSLLVIRFPDVAYTPRETILNISHAQQWVYQGEPFRCGN